MTLYTLSTKSVKGLHVECKSLGLKNHRQKNKADLINYINLKHCFQAISTFEDDEYDILKLYFARLKLFKGVEETGEQGLEQGGIREQGQEQEQEQEGVFPLESLDSPRPSNDTIESYIESLRNDFCRDGPQSAEEMTELNFEPYEDERYNHLYSYHKKHLLDKYGDIGEHGEKILIHGTDEISIREILDSDFALTKDKRHGSVFGRGIYFTDDLRLACKYSEKGKTEKYFIVCQVHIGNTVLGRRDMDRLPKMEGQERFYDTAVNKISRTTQYVKFKNHTYNLLGILHLKILNEDSRLYTNDRGRNGWNGSGSGGISNPSMNYSITNQPPNNSINQSDNLSRLSNRDIRSMRTPLKHNLTLVNKTKMRINVYHVGHHLLNGKLKIPTDELKIFLNLWKKDLMPATYYHDRILTYCETNKLQTNEKYVYLPNQDLITLLNISPTTRISHKNIEKLIKPLLVHLNKENMSYITYHSRCMYTIESDRENKLKTFQDHHFICGFFTDKKPHPYNFVVVDDFIVDKSEVRELILK